MRSSSARELMPSSRNTLRMPGFVFSAPGPVHVSRDLGLLSFNLGMPEQAPAVSGVDVALVRDGRIAVLHTLLTAEG
jgi:hypothetical protein